MSILYFIIFLIVFSSIYFGIHYFVYIQIVKGLLLSPIISNLLRKFFLFGALSFALGELLSRRFWVYPIIYFGAVWLGAISIAFSIFLLKNIAAFFFPNQPKALTTIAIIATFIVCILSLYNASGTPKIKHIKIPLEKLRPEMSGFSIIQLSDLHLNSLTSKKWLDLVIDTTNKLNPDLVVITGDLIDSSIFKVQRFCSNLKRLKAQHGILAITGNHEFYAGIDDFIKMAEEANIKVLRNQHLTIADSIQIAGIDDNTGKRFRETGTNLKSAMQKCDLNKPIILLSHQPKYFNQASMLGADLQLSGHTHAGQIPPMDLIVWLVFKYPYGLYKNKTSYIYTTSGTGTWGHPMRLFSKSEIVKITFVKK